MDWRELTSGLTQGDCELATCLMTKRINSLRKFWRMCMGRSLIPGYTFTPLIILGRVKVGIGEASSNWIMEASWLARGGWHGYIRWVNSELMRKRLSRLSSLGRAKTCCCLGSIGWESKIEGRQCHMVRWFLFASHRQVQWHQDEPLMMTRRDQSPLTASTWQTLLQ